MRRVALIGNAGGGKTTLARLISQAFVLPVRHVDSIQFQSGWEYTPEQECDAILDGIAATDRWIIDGFGSKQVIERRLNLADTVVLVKFHFATHLWWAAKRQWRSRLGPRPELPRGCPEFTFWYTYKLLKAMSVVKRDYSPWFRELILGLPASTAVFHLKSPGEYRAFLREHVKSQIG